MRRRLLSSYLSSRPLQIWLLLHQTKTNPLYIGRVWNLKKKMNKRKISGAYNPDRPLFKVILKNLRWSTGVFHGPGPRRGPYTKSTGMVHGLGVHGF